MKIYIIYWLSLTLTLSLTSIAYADPPDWAGQFNVSDYEFNASMTGILLINGEVARDSLNQIAAFVEDEVRGVATPIAIGDQWLFFLTVYSNAAVGEVITFRAYIAGQDTVLPVAETVEFQLNAIIGQPNAPFEWNVTRLIYDLNQNQQVDVGDIQWLCQFYLGSQLGDPNYFSQFDYDQNHAIDETDLVYLMTIWCGGQP